jgi:membrane protein implicated in regulation of membrane protease activity
MWGLWWVWLSGAVVLGLIEIAVPGYVFLGFALGAAITGVVLLVGGPVAGALAASVPALALFFAVVSLLAWLGLRRVLGIRKGQIKIIDRDINED